MPSSTPPDDAVRPGPLQWALRAAGVVVVLALLVALWQWFDREAFMAWKQQAGPVPFFAAMAVLPALGLPVTPFFIVAGATFGVAMGLGGSLAALLVNFSLCYWIARSGLRPFLLRVLGRFASRIPDFDGRRDRAVGFVLLVKFAPGVPAFAKNYLLGVAGVPFRLYLVLSMLISGVYAAAFVLLGESVLERDASGAALAVGVLLAAGLAFWWVRRKGMMN
ncbi:MAG: TVP38/TMEM64 family protein [Lysobacteraceae bacterium]